MLKWDWKLVRTGQIIWFLYGEGAARVHRTCLVLMSPDDPHAFVKRKTDKRTVKLLHAIQLKEGIRNLVSGADLRLLFKRMGGVQLLTEYGDNKYYELAVNDPQRAYRASDHLIKRNDIYRTFNVRKSKRTTVYLVDYKFPVDMIPKEIQ